VLVSAPSAPREAVASVEAATGRRAGRELLFMSTHIDYRRDDTERLRNVAEFKEIVQEHPRRPVLLCGDFNDVPESRTHRAMEELFIDVWRRVGEGKGFTYPSQQAVRRIDYLWYLEGRGLEPVRAWVPETLASDHLPVVAEFRLAGSTPASEP
jgi:endonuclease/exonuclease/phosphatase (EEP) superfamily protein YafD